MRLVEGCGWVSPGCTHCWSESQAHIRSKQSNPLMQAQYGGVTTPDGKWNGHIKLLKQNLELPLKRKKPTVWAIWNDLMLAPAWFIDRALEIVSACPQHIVILCTKRPELLEEKLYSPGRDRFFWGRDILPNLWLGVTAENQEMFDKRWAYLKQIPAAVYMISYEPALGPLALPPDFLALGKRALLICGGESGPKARPMHPDWARKVRDDCVEAGVAYFFKQWGEYITPSQFPLFDRKPLKIKQCKNWGVLDINGNYFKETTPWNGKTGKDSETKEYVIYKVGKKAAGRELDGNTYNQLPGA